MTVLGIIPARHASTRFPGKPLAVLAGKPMIQWVWERATAARSLDEVVVATEDRRILDCVSAFGGRAVATSPDHATGTDRLAEVARGADHATVLVNVQGDEPCVDPASIDACVEALLRDREADVSTIASPLTEAGDFDNPHVVKVVLDGARRALYFSRAPIPSSRSRKAGEPPPSGALKHAGLYAFRREALLRIASLPQSPLEIEESLEQLRAMQAGMRIVVAEGRASGPAVDVPGDVAVAEAALRALHRPS